jgi:hypothetical protein
LTYFGQKWFQTCLYKSLYNINGGVHLPAFESSIIYFYRVSAGAVREPHLQNYRLNIFAAEAAPTGTIKEAHAQTISCPNPTN